MVVFVEGFVQLYLRKLSEKELHGADIKAAVVGG